MGLVSSITHVTVQTLHIWMAGHEKNIDEDLEAGSDEWTYGLRLLFDEFVETII